MIPVTQLEKDAGVNKNRIRSWAKRKDGVTDPSSLSKGQAITALLYLSNKEPGNAAHYKSLIAKINGGRYPTPPEGNGNRSGNGNTNVTTQPYKKITDTVTVNPKRPASKGNAGNKSGPLTPGNGNGNVGNAVVRFLRGSVWKGMLAVTAVAVSADYLAVLS